MRLFFIILVLLSLQLHVFSQQQCNSAEYRQELLRRSPEFAARAAAIEIFTKRLLSRNAHTNDTVSVTQAPDLITIPVVVHVIYHSSSQNISDAQVRSQIDVLNSDYRRQNADTGKTPAIFRSVAAD